MLLRAEQINRQFIRNRGGSNIFYAVQNTDLVLQSGKLTVITGRSGSGKSTLLNMFSGILAPSEGKILADDIDLYQMEDADLSAFRGEHFGVIPQGQTAIFSLNVTENIMLPMALYHLDRKAPEAYHAAETYAVELMELTGIADLKDVMPSELSGGEMRRMAIARALIRNPEIVFADEPTGDLDDENTQIVLSLLRKIANDGKAVLLVTHEKEAIAYADEVYSMDAGILTRVES